MAIPSFAPPLSDHTRPFWDGVAAGELRLPRCSACQSWQWYPLSGTTHCAGATIDWTRGTAGWHHLHLYRRPAALFTRSAKTDVPIVSIIVELDDAPASDWSAGCGRHRAPDRHAGDRRVLPARRSGRPAVHVRRWCPAKPVSRRR